MNTPCILYTGRIRKDGYGFHKNSELAHIRAYRLAKGEIPYKHIIHHKCVNRLCINPEHLEAVLQKDHPDAAVMLKRSQTHCINGHEFTKENTNTTIDVYGDSHRHCRACDRRRHRRYKRDGVSSREDQTRTNL